MAGRRAATVLCVLALGVTAAEGRKGGEPLSFHIRDETAPAGSLVQMKVMETEVTPISGGRPRMAFDPAVFDRFEGVGMFAPTGELAGAALREGNHLTLTYVTTSPSTGGEYPVLTVALRLRSDAATGSRALFTLEPASIWTLDGATIASKKSTATVTVGGSLAVSDVVPSGGSFPAGTLVSVRGVGFVGGARVRLNGTRIDAAQVVSSTEIQLTLTRAVDMAGAELRIDNPDGGRVLYYSYLRGIAAATSLRPLLSATEPVFSGAARAQATFGPLSALNPAFQYAALALQNPSLERTDLTLELYAAGGTLVSSASRSLDGGHRLLLELSELFDGAALPPGGSLRVTSSRPVQAFTVVVDERIASIVPRLPNEAAP